MAASLLCGIALTASPAMAHQPVILDEADATSADGPLLRDGTVSFAVSAELEGRERRGFRFCLDEGDRAVVQYLITDESPHNRLSRRELPRVILTDPEGERQVLRIRERTRFYEPYGGRTYLYLSRVDRPGMAGTYRVDVIGRSASDVDVVIGVGTREVAGVVSGSSARCR